MTTVLPQVRPVKTPAHEATFNKAAFMPQCVLDKLPGGHLTLSWTAHALAELDKDGFDLAHHFPDGFDPESVRLADHDVVEVTARGHKLHPYKVVLRVKTRRPQGVTVHTTRPTFWKAFDSDLVLVLEQDRHGHGWRVNTCWANDRKDDHKTLDRSRVALAPVRI